MLSNYAYSDFNAEDFKSYINGLEDQCLVKNDHIVRVVAKHLPEWEPLGRILGLSEAIIIEIRNNNQQNYREQKYQCIMQWTSEQGQAAKLITLLRKIYFELENKSLVLDVVEGMYVRIVCLYVCMYVCTVAA